MPIQNNLKQISLGIHTATFVESANGGVWNTTNGGQSSIPLLVIEGRGGTKLTFTTAVLREVILAGGAMQKVTISFDSTTAAPPPSAARRSTARSRPSRSRAALSAAAFQALTQTSIAPAGYSAR